ncbi:cytochrome P450 [Streptomyces sp. WAC 01325]|uniref:cytochrome P450 family protein n=1 Tax=Streptomyces sp. WAC 01325 TaxID=2203202 RepID=UPI000F8687A6|nr:cytochrome P450 [Streptomyces sp. WAC 01325]RSN18749.1 cytochrome P450 [Streptomyces sp. WAC 01325]
MDRALPLVLDPTGHARPHEEAALHSAASATLVDILGVTAWSISDPAVLKSLLNDSRVSKDASQHWPEFISGEITEKWPLALWVGVNNMFTAYGDNHRRLRRLVSKAFTARRTIEMVPRIEQITDRLIDDLVKADADEVVDLRETLAYPLPIQVIGDLMGLPEDTWPRFRTVVDGVFDTTLTSAEARTNTMALYAILTELVAAKRATPGGDITSVLINARDDEGGGSVLTETELLDTLLLVISAGYETTVNLLDQAVTALLTHPDQLAHVRAGRASWDDVIEEALRYAAPISHLPLRYAVEDILLPEGIVIHQGEAILASYGAAGRHPNLHGETAGTFDVMREDKQHLSFGHGAHFCLGAPLARAEARSALPALFNRFPDMSLAVPAAELEPLASLLVNGHRTLPVRLHLSSTTG